ncbi:HEAT repeat domain-containing protein [Hymenobacter monticola]|uniref:HEAT repeat domain-containing protein n=1 Tax=Hymenobacter monticola TaxID=1705399 RepID=A0ABY4AYA5_9BACT|nr:hypothetical protein [Hymenobacter monticola]UOE31878.1 hypothetical protein MTP16_12100 [Hymenobacter monticola]
MRILTKEQQKLVLEFIEGNILSDELEVALGPIPLDTPSLLIALFESAVASEKAEEADEAIGIANGFKSDKDFGKRAVPWLLALLAMPGHYYHEDIIGILQRIKDARAVDAVYEAALEYHSYLEYDEYSGLARKCTWALADIGNEEAYAKLKLLAANSNLYVAGYAQKRLDSWVKEQGRKAFHFLP